MSPKNDTSSKLKQKDTAEITGDNNGSSSLNVAKEITGTSRTPASTQNSRMQKFMYGAELIMSKEKHKETGQEEPGLLRKVRIGKDRVEAFEKEASKLRGHFNKIENRMEEMTEGELANRGLKAKAALSEEIQTVRGWLAGAEKKMGRSQQQMLEDY